MSVVNAFVQGGFAYLLTDMACTDQATGRLLWVDSKFIKGSEPFPWGAAVTGNVSPVAVLASIEKHNPVTPTQFFERLPAIVATVGEMAAKDGIVPAQCAVAVALYSKRDKAPAVIACDLDGSIYGGLMPALTAFSAEALVSGPIMADELLGRPVDVRDEYSFKPSVDGIALVAAQRRRYRWASGPGAAEAYRAGGGVQLMRVGRRGVTIETLATWPEDRVGGLIEPWKVAA